MSYSLNKDEVHKQGMLRSIVSRFHHLVCLGHDLDSCILICSAVVQKVAAFLLSCILIGLQFLEKKEASQILTIF